MEDRRAAVRKSREERLLKALQAKPHFERGAIVPPGPHLLGRATEGSKVMASHKRRVSQPAPQPAASPPAGRSILITGGLGDALAVESYFSPAQRAALSRIYYATRQHHPIAALFASTPAYSHVEHVVVWSDFSQFFCFYHKSEVEMRLRAAGLQVPAHWPAVTDHSIAAVFPAVSAGTVPYTGSGVLSAPVADVEKFLLPARYVVCCPYTINDKRLKTRDFNSADWAELLRYLASVNLPAVVVNTGDDPVPQHHLVTDLSNRTTVAEAVEVLKGAEGYYGIDSAFSVLAAKLFSPPRLVVKSGNPFLFAHKHIYYAPQKDFGFIRERLTVDV